MISTSIQDLFDGKIKTFISRKTKFFGGISQFFEEQLIRLSSLEQNIIYWLAINRNWTNITELQADIVPYVSERKLLAAIESLKWRSLIELKDSYCTLPSVFIDYVSASFLEKIIAEIIRQPIDVNQFHLLKSHALINNYQPVSIQEAEKFFLVQPCVNELINTFGTPKLLKIRLNQILFSLRKTSLLQQRGYILDNIDNLLLELAKLASSNSK